MHSPVLLEGGTIVTMNAAMDVVASGALLVEQGRIRFVGPRSELDRLPPETEIIDVAGHLVLPGLINAHTHLPMSLFRGLADDLPLDVWLEEHMFPAEAQFIRPDTVELGTRLSLAEMLLSGTTSCADGYFLEEAVLRTASAVRFRGIFAQGVIDFPAPGVPDPAENIAVAREFLSEQSGSTHCRTAVFAHSPYTCSATTLVQAKALAEEFGLLFFLHAAETALEADRCRADHGGMTPVRYLASLGLLDRRTVLVHAVHVDEEEQDIVAASDAGVCICSESNMKLAAGVAPLRGYRERGVRVGLGTDGCASNNDLDMFLEMRSTAFVQKLHNRDPAFLEAADLLVLATSGGALVLGLEEAVGSLEPGKQADVVVVDASAPHAMPMYDPYSFLLYSAAGSDVTHVLSDGELVVRDSELVDWDLPELLQSVRNISEGIRRFAKSV